MKTDNAPKQLPEGNNKPWQLFESFEETRRNAINGDFYEVGENSNYKAKIVNRLELVIRSAFFFSGWFDIHIPGIITITGSRGEILITSNLVNYFVEMYSNFRKKH